MRMRWDTLHEAVRCAVAHRHDWPLPIAIVADWEVPCRTPGPARYCALANSTDDPRAVVFVLGRDELHLLTPLLDDFLELDQALEQILHSSDGEATPEPAPDLFRR